MSKLLAQYDKLKKEDNTTVYMIRSGIFYCFFNEDARQISNAIGLQITDLGTNIFKCGFPASHIAKYKSILDSKGIKYKIIDNLPNQSLNQFLGDVEIKKVLKKIKELNFDELTPKQAWDLLFDLQQKIK